MYQCEYPPPPSSHKRANEDETPTLRNASQLHQVRLSFLSPNDRLDTGKGSICGGANNAFSGGANTPNNAFNHSTNVFNGIGGVNSVGSVLSSINAGTINSGQRDSLTLPNEEEPVINVYSRKSSLARTGEILGRPFEGCIKDVWMFSELYILSRLILAKYKDETHFYPKCL